MTIEQRKSRWRNLYKAGGSKFVYNIDLPFENIGPAPFLWPEYKQERVDYAVRMYEARLKRAEWLDDDSIPYVAMSTGTEIYAEALGAKVFHPTDNMPFALPFIENSEQAARLTIPDVQNTSLMDLIEMAAQMRARVGKDAILKIPDMQSPMDILAVMWDKTDLFAAMADEDEREIIIELSRKICKFFMDFMDIWFAEFGTNYISHHPDYYMEGGITLSVDEIGSVSPRMFYTYFLDELNVLSRHFGGIGIHCCADSRHQWEGLKKVEGLRLLNLHRKKHDMDESYKVFKNCVHYPMYIENVLAIPGPELPEDYPDDQRIVITRYAQNRDEALRIAETMRPLCVNNELGY